MAFAKGAEVTSESYAAMATPDPELYRKLMDPRVPKNEEEWFAKRRIEELEAKLVEAEKRTSHVAENLLGRQMLPLTKNECEALLHSVFTADPSPVLMTQDELAEVREHWERFAKDENKMDAAWLAFNLGPLLDHSQLQSAQIEKAEAECSRLEMLLEQRDQQLLSHAQNEHPHEYKELVEVLSREEKLKAKLAEVEKRHEACEEPLIERGCLRKGKEGE